MTTIVIFGGTFDPVHDGHVQSAIDLRNLLSASQVVFVPCLIPAHRPQPTATIEQRIEMLRLAVKDETGLGVSDMELRRGGVSYTTDTLRQFREELGEQISLVFMLGLDSFLTLPSWHDWKSLCDDAHLAVIARPGFELTLEGELESWTRKRQVTEVAEISSTASGKVIFVELTQHPVSASDIRGDLLRKTDLDHVLNDEVYRYIKAQHLYLSA